MNYDNELFELKHKVFLATGWLPEKLSVEYLLEKLPKQLDNNNGESNWIDIYAGDDLWFAMYEYASSDPDGSSYRVESDTPLKALLKLVLALKKADEL